MGRTTEKKKPIHRPVYHTELLTLLALAGCGEIELLGVIAMKPFDPAASNDIVIIARK